MNLSEAVVILKTKNKCDDAVFEKCVASHPGCNGCDLNVPSELVDEATTIVLEAVVNEELIIAST